MGVTTRTIEAHVGSWEEGRVISLVVPGFSTITSTTSKSNTRFNPPATKLEDYINGNETVFSCTEQATTYLTSSGCNVFTYLMSSSDDSVDLYISENNYITLEYSAETGRDWGPNVNIVLTNKKTGVSTGYGAAGRWFTLPIAIPNYENHIAYAGLNFRSLSDAANGLYDVGIYVVSVNADTYAMVSHFYDDAEDASDDPYSSGGTSGTGGGTGTFSGTGDSIEFPNLPTLSAVSTGFITLFNPSIAQMQSLATYMWSDVFDIGLYKTLFADPMDCILGCSIVPVAVPNGGTKTVNVGNVSTGISMTVAASQYVEVDCGTLNVEEFWGSYLDYDPYTKAEIYLPYCGTHALQVDDIMGKAVHVKYHVDILSGACCAYVKCGSSVMYSFVGQCSSSIPISANDWTNVVNGALTIAASVGSLIATGGASAPMAVGAAAAVTGTIYGGGIKQNVEKSGSMGGTGGMLAVQTPYLILTRPRQALPKKQNTYTGYPSFITTKLSDLKGYTEIDSIRITGVPATDAELNELESILKSGVIF